MDPCEPITRLEHLQLPVSDCFSLIICRSNRFPQAVLTGMLWYCTQIPTVLSITGAVLICVSTFSLGAFEKTHPVVSLTPDPSVRGGSAAADGLGQYSALPGAEAANWARS